MVSLLNVLFALNQNHENEIESILIKEFKDRTSINATFSKEYDTDGVMLKLNLESFNLLILNEDLERDEPIYTSYVDELTDKHPDLRIIFLANSEHEGDLYVKKLFNIGVYDVIYAHDVSVDELVKLMIQARTKSEAKEYLGLFDVEEVIMENELTYIPEEQLNNIINHLVSDDLIKLKNDFEHIYKQYNKTQMVYLYKYLPKETKDKLIGFSLFDDIATLVKAKEEIVEENEENSSKNEIKRYGKLKYQRKSKIKKTNEKKKEDENYRGKIIGSVYIGVANVSRGAGASYNALSLASYIASVGNSVCVLENNDNPVFSNLSKDKLSTMLSLYGVDIYYMNKNKDLAEQEVFKLRENYQYIISDLGILKYRDNNIYKNNDVYKEFIRNNIKLLVLSGLSYKWGEIYPFLVSEDISKWKLLVSPTSEDMKKIIKKELSDYSKDIHFLDYCDNPFNPNDCLIETYKEILGNDLNILRKKKIRIPGFGFGIKF